MSADFATVVDIVSRHSGAVISIVGGILSFYAVSLAAAWRATKFFYDHALEMEKKNREQLERRYRDDIYRLKVGEPIDLQFPEISSLGPAEYPSTKPLGARLLDGDRFMALVDNDAWSLDNTASTETVVNEWFGGELQKSEELKGKLRNAVGDPVHRVFLWRGHDDHMVGHKFIKRMYPFVIVQRRDYKDSGVNPLSGELANFIDWLRAFDKLDDHTTFNFGTIRMNDSLAYMRGYFLFEDITIDGAHIPRYYLMRQILIVAARPHIFCIYTGYPNPAFESPYLSHLKTWWAAFQIGRVS